MKKYFAGYIAGYGELFAQVDTIQTYGGDYELHRIVKVHKIYWMTGRIMPASTFEGTHITGSDYRKYVWRTFDIAKQKMIALLQQGRHDLEQAIVRVDHMITQVSDVGE